MRKLIIIFAVMAAQGTFAEEKIKITSHAKAEASVNEITVGVKGMVCAFCAQGIEKSFMKQKEVAAIEVSLANKYIKIKFKDGQRLANEKIAQLLKESGYEAVFGG